MVSDRKIDTVNVLINVRIKFRVKRRAKCVIKATRNADYRVMG